MQQVVVHRRCSHIARLFALLVLEGRVGAPLDQHLAQLQLAHDGGVVQRGVVLEPGRVDVGTGLDQCQCHIVVAVVARLVQRGPPWGADGFTVVGNFVFQPSRSNLNSGATFEKDCTTLLLRSFITRVKMGRNVAPELFDMIRKELVTFSG